MDVLGFVSIFWIDPKTGEIEGAESLECMAHLEPEGPKGFYVERAHAAARAVHDAMSRWVDQKVLWKFSRGQIHYPDRTYHGEAILRADEAQFFLTEVGQISDSGDSRLFFADEPL